MLLSLISTLDQMQQTYFHGFFEEQDPLLFRYAVYLMRDHHQAEEALQNAWLQCLSNRETFFAIPENIRPAWMRSVLRNAAHDLYRQARRFVPLDDDWDVYGDNVFEKDGIRRDRTGDGEKTRCLCGKRGIFNRDGPAMGPQIIRQLE